MQQVTSPTVDRRILAWTAHELTNTLSPLSTAMDLLSNGDPERRAWALAIAKRQLSCMRQLVSDMTEAAINADASQKISRQRILLQQLLEECIADFGAIFATRNQHISSLLESRPLWVHADPIRLRQVFSNLLSNAAKYTPRHGHVSISCTKAAFSYAEVVIADDGAGILPEHLTRIFEAAYREDRAKAIAPGLGVGLSVASSLVKAHGGSIRAESSGAGKGSRFVLRLPLLRRRSCAVFSR